MNIGITWCFAVRRPLSHEPWWLEAVAPGKWGVAEVRRGGAVVASWPYVRTRSRTGKTYLTMPPLTMCLGPWTEDSDAREYGRLSREEELFGELTEGLPRFDCLVHDCPPDLGNWLPFHWRGFSQTTRYTYVLEDLSDLDALWSGFQGQVRRNVRKAEQLLSVRDDFGFDVLYRLFEATYRRQGLSAPVGSGLARRLFRACEENRAGKAYFAEDASGQIHAAIFVVWNQDSAYYLFGGSEPEFATSQGMTLLFWHALQEMAARTKCFDFEGSMSRPIERYFRSFGARQVPYFRLEKVSPRMRRIRAALEFYRSLRGSA